MAWGKAGSTTLTSSASAINLTVESCKFNNIITHIVNDTGINPWIRMDNNAGDYSSRWSINGATDGTLTNNTNGAFPLWGSEIPITHFGIIYALNISSEEKLIIAWATEGLTGATNAPSRREGVGKYAQTSAQVSSFDYHTSVAGDFLTDSNLTVLGSDLTPAAAVPFPTNVQVGSRAEITDTRKMYNYTNPLTFEDDFSSSTGWTTVGSGLSITGGKLDANFTGSSDNRIYKDLGFNLENKFISHFDYYQGTVSSGYWDMFSFTSGTSKPFTSSQDQIGAIINLSGYNVLARSYDGSSENTSQSGAISLSANTQYYVTTIRDGTSFEIKVYSDSARTTQVGSTISQTLSTNISLPLRYFQTGHYIGGSGTPIYQIDNLKIYNGVTQTTNYWQEIGA